MFRKIPQVNSSEEILDKAFRRTKKIKITDRDAYYRRKKEIIAKTETFADTLSSTLEGYVKNFPSIDNLSSFYQEIISIKIDKDKLKKSLGGIDWARKTCQMIYSKQSRFLRKSKELDFLKDKQKEIYGRMSSVVNQIGKELDFLSNAQKILRKMPDIHDIPTVVIAGYPNVGKSSILKCISRAKPEVAIYPFTTKQIFVGHIEKKVKHEKMKYQVIDTPGLFDRPVSKRNKIEQEAIAAIRYLADVIVFVIDPSETCGYSIKKQMNLLDQLKEMFDKSFFVIVENKSDLKQINSDYLKISCEDKKGFDELVEKLFSFYEKIEKKDK
jgi:nucleolar GTP-binding protein